MRWRVCISVYVRVCVYDRASECEFVLVSARVCVREREREREGKVKNRISIFPPTTSFAESLSLYLCVRPKFPREVSSFSFLWDRRCVEANDGCSSSRKRKIGEPPTTRKRIFFAKNGPKKCFQFWNWKWEQANCEGGPGESGAFTCLFLFMPARNWSRRRELSRSLLVFGWLDKTGIQNVPSTWLKWDQRIVVTVSWSTFTSNWIHLVHLFLPRNVNTLGCSALSWSMIAGNCH